MSPVLRLTIPLPRPSITFDATSFVCICVLNSDDLCYTLADLKDLVHRTRRSNGLTHRSFGTSHRHFFACSAYLLARGHLCERKQSDLYLRGLPKPLRTSVSRGLSIKLPDVLLEDGYPMESIREAATFVLTRNRYRSSDDSAPGSSDDIVSQSSPRSSPFAPTSASLRPRSPLLPSGLHRVPVRSPTPGGMAQNTPRREQVCFKNSIKSFRFCGDPRHFIRDCPTATQYLSEGKATRNSDGRISLPNGRVPPRNVPGKNLLKRFDNYWIAKGLRRQDQTNHGIVSRQSP